LAGFARSTIPILDAIGLAFPEQLLDSADSFNFPDLTHTAARAPTPGCKKSEENKQKLSKIQLALALTFSTTPGPEMLRNRIYYGLKPFIPQSLRTAIRRKLATRLRRNIGDVWPIMPGSERPPEDWPGWPQGKKFAFVLTHDVESEAGLNRCRCLMELELELGFRSSFNFIPEGDYQVPAELRQELTATGFEVGIHDLKHDGWLFASRRTFKRGAERINHYVREWGVSGFRSGFMFRNLDWLHDLDVQYDASTFDTDPFEPQPDGRHTIFPFWVSAPLTGHSEFRDWRSEGKAQSSNGTDQKAEARDQRSDLIGRISEARPQSSAGTGQSIRSGGGYVELPYTLPQDFTLFVLLQEKTPEIWLRKLDWIAQHGGMALVDVHPDYLCFDDAPGPMQYPASHYKFFLDYVNRQYSGAFWNARPSDVAQFCGSSWQGAQH
jgi:hypothetical protein